MLDSMETSDKKEKENENKEEKLKKDEIAVRNKMLEKELYH